MFYRGLIVCFIAVSLCFSASLKVQAEEESHQMAPQGVYRHQNEVDFDLEKLSGLTNDNNKDFRDKFYSRVGYELGQKHTKGGSQDKINNTIEEYELFIDCSLGVDFPKNKRAAIIAAQRKMLTEKNFLDTATPRMDKDAYVDNISFHFENFLEEVASILTDEEFELLFKISKTEINTAFELFIYNGN